MSDLPIRASKKKDKGYYEPYAQFSRALRVWFLAYGVGAPVLFFTRERTMDVLLAQGCARLVALLFLGGVALQIVAAIVYKSAMWALYSAELDSSEESTLWYKWSDRISDAYWLELAIDVVTFVSFGIATWLVLIALTTPA